MTAMDVLEILLNQIEATLPHDRRALRRLKIQAAEASGNPLIRNEVLLARYREDVHQGRRAKNTAVEAILQLNKIRSQSGIATVTVITKPYACPGRCVYCPTEASAPKSYLTNEPAVMRAIRNEYDAYHQVHSRLEALTYTGHPTDKIELIIKGGSWSFYPESYQRSFIQRCIQAANDFQLETASEQRPQQEEPLASTIRKNEIARHRIIGITIETRPDYIDPNEIRRLRELGVTRVELGIQSLDPNVLKTILRDHDLETIQNATRLLKDSGFKVAYHLMPNLPGATPDSDVSSMRTLFEHESYQPDTMKLYPCVVIETAELHEWWKTGRFHPYDDETLTDVLIRMKTLVPPYVRIERVIRDIPSHSIKGGCTITNLRETVLKKMAERGLSCRCIRCRQVREEPAAHFTLVERCYKASGGAEYFLSFEDPGSDQLASLLRLRISSDSEPLFSALHNAALVRELHSYGKHLPLHERGNDAVQHSGFGQRLMARAESIAREQHCKRIAVIAGIGVREYYRRLGYHLEETYMVKAL